jgi:acetate kinase
VEGWSPQQLEEWLNHRCGLFGVSGDSDDMRTLLASSEPAAALAVGMFCYRAKKYVGAFLSALGGADAVLIGGGIGEHAPTMRARILSGMAWAGIGIDDESNAAALQGDARIDSQRGAVQVWVIAVDEAERIAQYAAQIVQSLP